MMMIFVRFYEKKEIKARRISKSFLYLLTFLIFRIKVYSANFDYSYITECKVIDSIKAPLATEK